MRPGPAHGIWEEAVRWGEARSRESEIPETAPEGSPALGKSPARPAPPDGHA